ncbi:hypothetical protein RB595_002127 [Gaeumannomyces hyphopodioides]
MASAYTPRYFADNMGFSATAGQRQEPTHSPAAPPGHYSHLVFIKGEHPQSPAEQLTGDYAWGHGGDWAPPSRYNQHFSSRYGDSRFPDLSRTFSPPPRHMLPSPPPPPSNAQPAYSSSPAAEFGVTYSQCDSLTEGEAAAAATPETPEESNNTICSFIQDAIAKASAAIARVEAPAVAAFISAQPGEASRLIDAVVALGDAAARVRALLAELSAGRQESYELVWPAVGRVVGLVAELEAALGEVGEIIRAREQQQQQQRQQRQQQQQQQRRQRRQQQQRLGPCDNSCVGYYPVVDERTGRHAFVRGPVDQTVRPLDPLMFARRLAFSAY